ncbi:hypothetical protein [Streptomyces phaeochromogenes]|uniref:hypothetical protein n=1 Tax=Streptomyces phaeochromogenes TaxID=1923 RepID=UPI003685F837
MSGRASTSLCNRSVIACTAAAWVSQALPTPALQPSGFAFTASLILSCHFASNSRDSPGSRRGRGKGKAVADEKHVLSTIAKPAQPNVTVPLNRT